MKITFERPQVLWLLLLTIFFIFFVINKCRKIKKSTEQFIANDNDKLSVLSPNEIYFRLLLKSFFRIAAWICLVLSLAGISWGSVSVPVQKNGRSCAFVFDISYSMTANDAPNNLTRLEASVEYAKMLMDYMQGVSISCVIAKGDGVIAIPQTEDFSSIYSLLSMLSPEMMSSKGSSLGSGIESAISSFPQTSSKAPVIFLFTDGDETDTGLLPALNSAVRSGINVCIIGFGSDRETEVIAGDGKTVVKTALRDEKLLELCQQVNKKNQTGKDFSFIKTSHVKFVDASEVGSAVKVIYELKNLPAGKNYSAKEILNANSSQDFVTVSYEMQQVKRHKLFLFLTIILYAISVLFSEFSLRNLKNITSVALIFIVPNLFTSCSASFKDSKTILESTWNWYQKDYNKAISGFSQTIENANESGDELTKQYALYGLSVTYLMQNEKTASLERLEQISPNAPVKIKFASYYNAGIIAQQEGDYEKAIDLFKLALLVSPEDVNAKINLELSRSQETQKAKEGQQEMTPSTEDKNTESDIEKTIFNRMQENDQKQWKNFESLKANNSVIDY